MLGQLRENLLRSLSMGQPTGAEPVAQAEPDYARATAIFILRWKRCPRCQKLWSMEPRDLQFLSANRALFSETYRTICLSGHPVFVTLFPSGTPQMLINAQDEITPFLPRQCGPRRSIRTSRVTPFQENRGGNELTFIRSCQLSSHNHDEYARYYEKPGWESVSAIS